MKLTGAFQAAVERYATDKEVNGVEEGTQADQDGKLPKIWYCPRLTNQTFHLRKLPLKSNSCSS